MNCPKCYEPLRIADRQGIEIDYCPDCRGIWLDRGELDKIIERSVQYKPPEDYYRDDYKRDEYKRDEYKRDDYKEYKKDKKDKDKYYKSYKKKKAKHFIEDIFDIFD